MVLWRTDRPAQLARWVRIDIAPLGALTSGQYHIGGVVARGNRGGGGAQRSTQRRPAGCESTLRAERMGRPVGKDMKFAARPIPVLNIH